MNRNADPELDYEVEPDTDDDQPEHAAELDPEVRARRDAALRQVRTFGDPALRTRALPVEHFDDALRAEVERMGALMSDSLGIGLAATQLGVLHRVLVYRVERDSPVVELVNPEIEWTGEELETMEEGCLSLPGVHVDVERAVNVRVRGCDARGGPVLVEASGLEARVVQHEVDHLDGVLILDRTTREQRREAMRAMREAELGAAGLGDGDSAEAESTQPQPTDAQPPQAERERVEPGQAGPDDTELGSRVA